MNLEEIKAYYREAPTPYLLELSNKLSGLEQEVIPILQNELYKRNQEEAVARVNAYLRNPDKPINVEELRAEIN